MNNPTYVHHHAIILNTNTNFFDLSFDIQPETGENLIKVIINNKCININTSNENDYHVIEIYDERITDGNLIETFTIRNNVVFNEEWYKLIPKCYEYLHIYSNPYTIKM